MDVNVTFMEIKRWKTDDGRQVMSMAVQDDSMERPITVFFHSSAAIAQAAKQFYGETPHLDHFGVDDVNYLAFPSPWGLRVVELDGGVLGEPNVYRAYDHRFVVPGRLIASWIDQACLNCHNAVTITADEFKKIAWDYRSRAIIKFMDDKAAERFRRCVKGPYGEGLASCARGELSSARRTSAGQRAEVRVATDFATDSFYFEVFTPEGSRLWNGGWILHPGYGYSSHH